MINGFKCICEPGFTSKDCSININDCESSPCLNDGQCIDKVNEFECVCKNGYFGSLCEHHNKFRTTDFKVEHKSKTLFKSTTSASQLTSINERPSAERLNSEQLILISIISLIVPLSALLIYVFLRYIKKRKSMINQNNGLPCKSIEEIEVLRQNEANINLLNNSSTLNNNLNLNHPNSNSKLIKTNTGANVIVNSLNSLNKASSVYSLNKAKSTMKLNNLNNENIYTTQYSLNNKNYIAQLRQQHSIYSTINNLNRHSMYGMIGGGGFNNKKLTTFTTAPIDQNDFKKFNQQPLYGTMKSQHQLNNHPLNNQLQSQQQKSIYETMHQYDLTSNYGQIKPDPNDIYSIKQNNLVYNIPPPNKGDKF